MAHQWKAIHERMPLVILCVVSSLWLTACDEKVSDLIIENHSDRALNVKAWVDPLFSVGPCSVHIEASAGSPSARSVPVKVTDQSGAVVYEQNVPTGREGNRRITRLVLPSSAEGECPAGVTGSYYLMVKNWAKEDARLVLEGKELAVVPAGATVTLGPFEGTWASARGLRAVAPNGILLGLGLSADYDLGNVPEFQVSIVMPVLQMPAR